MGFPKIFMVHPALSWMAIHTTVFFVLVLVLSETVLVLEGKLWDSVDKRAKYWGF